MANERQRLYKEAEEWRKQRRAVLATTEQVLIDMGRERCPFELPSIDRGALMHCTLPQLRKFVNDEAQALQGNEMRLARLRHQLSTGHFMCECYLWK